MIGVGLLFSQFTLLNTDVYAAADQCGEEHFMGLRAWYDGVDAVCDGTQPSKPEEIREMIKDGSESGHIDQAQTAMIENVFEMDDVAVEEICTHRSEVITLNLNQDVDVWHQIIHDHRHTEIGRLINTE